MDIEQRPHYDAETLLYACSDPFGEGRFTLHFSDGTALLVAPGGSSSRWLEDAPEVASWARGPRVAWTWVPAPVRAEAWRRVAEFAEVIAATTPYYGDAKLRDVRDNGQPGLRFLLTFEDGGQLAISGSGDMVAWVENDVDQWTLATRRGWSYLPHAVQAMAIAECRALEAMLAESGMLFESADSEETELSGTSDAGGWANEQTGAVMELISTDVAMREALLDAVNSAMPVDTVDGQAAEAGAVARGLVMGSIVDGTITVTPETATMVATIADGADVEWGEVGEALLVAVIAGE